MMLQVNSEFLWGRCGLPESRTPRRESSEASLGAAKEDVGTVFQGHRHNTLNGRPPGRSSTVWYSVQSRLGLPRPVTGWR